MSLVHAKKGFTLIEILLVLAMLAVIFVMALPNLARSTERQEMLAASEFLRTGLQNARAFVLTGEVYGESTSKGIAMDILRDPLGGKMRLFVDLDASQYYTGDLVCPQGGLPSDACTAFCEVCSDTANASFCPVTPAACQTYLSNTIAERDFLIRQMTLGRSAETKEFRTTEIGRIRLLESNGTYTDDAQRVSFHFLPPRADAKIYTPNTEAAPGVVESQKTEYAAACIEVRSLRAKEVDPEYKRIIYFNRTGGYTRSFPVWPEAECGSL